MSWLLAATSDMNLSAIISKKAALGHLHSPALIQEPLGSSQNECLRDTCFTF